MITGSQWQPEAPFLGCHIWSVLRCSCWQFFRSSGNFLMCWLFGVLAVLTVLAVLAVLAVFAVFVTLFLTGPWLICSVFWLFPRHICPIRPSGQHKPGSAARSLCEGAFNRLSGSQTACFRVILTFCAAIFACVGSLDHTAVLQAG